MEGRQFAEMEDKQLQARRLQLQQQQRFACDGYTVTLSRYEAGS